MVIGCPEPASHRQGINPSGNPTPKCSSSPSRSPYQFGSRPALFVQQLGQGGTAREAAVSTPQCLADCLPRVASRAVNRAGIHRGPFPRPLTMRIRPCQDLFERESRPEPPLLAKKLS